MKELFETASQLYRDWSDRKIGDFELIRQQAEIIQKIEFLWYHSPASKFYNNRVRGYGADENE